MAPWCDVLYACDYKFWEKYHDPSDGGLSWTEIGALKVTQDAQVPKHFPGVKRVPSEEAPGLSLDPLRIHQGENGGFQALNLAVLMGAERIILLGYDMQFNDKHHWHGDHVRGLNNPETHHVEKWRDNYRQTLPDLERAGVAVINCSRETALDCFVRMSLEAAIG